MILFLSAQDLQTFWVGLVEENTFTVLESCSVPPERYLFELDRFLAAQSCKPEQLSGICVVTGPGSFTSTRISITIANTLHFAYHTPLFSLANPDHLHPEHLLKEVGMGSKLASSGYTTAFYDRPPHITVPRGDKSLDS